MKIPPKKLMIPVKQNQNEKVVRTQMLSSVNTAKSSRKSRDYVPRIRSVLEKNRKVLDGPIVIVSPIRKRISPSARRAGSNKKRHPKKSNAIP